MNLFVKTEKYDHPWPMHHSEMYSKLGLSPTKHLPDAGLPPQYVQGIKIWVMSKEETKKQDEFYRVRAECPYCYKTMSFCKLQQHSKVHR